MGYSAVGYLEISKKRCKLIAMPFANLWPFEDVTVRKASKNGGYHLQILLNVAISPERGKKGLCHCCCQPLHTTYHHLQVFAAPVEQSNLRF